MPSLKEVRNRITSVTSTQQITKAMKMVSAAKLRRAQDAIIQMRPYANKLKEILENVSSTLDSSEGVYSQKRDVKRVLLVVVTSNRGLCGGFNANVIKRTNSLLNTVYKNCQVNLLCIGKKGNDYFKRFDSHVHGLHLPRHLHELFDNLTSEHVFPVAEKIMEAFVNKDYDKVEIIYNQFKNAAVQEVVVEQFLPVLPSSTPLSNTNATLEYIYEPTKAEIVQTLIPKSLKTQFYKTLLDSFAAEHGARMTAMHKATDNAAALLRELKISYNKARQAAITNEILEIVGGAEALKG
jgi:F-type H+-transporting ATPase subunit gamma